MVYESIVGINNTYHINASTSYRRNETKINTFCDESINITDINERIKIPLNLLDKTELCWDCQRKIELINYNRFPYTYDYAGEFEFTIRASIKIGNKRGISKIEVIPADTVEKAKEKFEEIYTSSMNITYNRISKSKNISSIETIYEQ